VAQGSFTTMLIIPTGVGAAIGGYAGDAIPVARAIAEISDRLITHPNVLNGAQLYWPLDNAFYVEGYGLDQFAAGHWNLAPVRSNRIGLVLDQGIEADLKLRHLQAADAARATLGVTIVGAIETDCPLEVELQTASSGSTWGTIQRPDSLLRATQKLVERTGANALAVIARFPEDLESEALHAYRQGQGVDPLAGAEAVISHLVVKALQIPCAHAPALMPLPLEATLSPRSAAEELGYTFLPSVLAGLSRAPQFTTSGGITRDTVDALIIPESCCGGSAVLSLAQTTTQIITVSENKTRMGVYPQDIGIDVIAVRSYLEAMGVLVAIKAGIDPDRVTSQTPVNLSVTLEKASP
jgi:hypothetical protein